MRRANPNSYANRWALVTGAGSGIGKAVAQRLASYGINIVLVGRDVDRLQSSAQEIVDSYGVKTHIESIDLTTDNAAQEVFDRCRENGLEIDILINNAGTFIFNDVLTTDKSRVDEIIRLHIVCVTEMCRLFAADMIARNGGRIVNMASFSIWMPWPGIALYSATKAYIRSFSLAFGREVDKQGVCVTAVSPAGVATDLYGLSHRLQNIAVRLGVLFTPQKAARKICRAMFNGRRHTIPGILNRMAIPFLELCRGPVLRLIRNQTMRFQK